MIDHNSSTPLYVQLEMLLTAAISSGVYKPGDKLPSEKDLCELYSVSRITVRQALNMLIQKGLAYSVQGKGTFIKALEINQDLRKIVRFGATLQQKGLDGYTIIKSYQSISTNSQAREKLGTNFGNLDMVGFVQSTPVVYYRSYIHSDIINELYRTAREIEVEHTPFSSYDLYDKLGIKIKRVDQTIGAMTADSRLKEIFKTSPNDAFIVLESVYYSQTDVPLEYKIGYYRSDIYTFQLQREL